MTMATATRGLSLRARALSGKDDDDRMASFEEAGRATKDAVLDFCDRYDVLSTLTGSLLVTSYCVMRGQCLWTAFSITVTATVAALVINELMTERAD